MRIKLTKTSLARHGLVDLQTPSDIVTWVQEMQVHVKEKRGHQDGGMGCSLTVHAAKDAAKPRFQSRG